MAILLALAEGDRHGYALMEDIHGQSDSLIRPGTGSLYTALQRLMGSGLIEEASGEPGVDRRRRYYGITELGRYVAGAEAQRMLKVLNVAAGRNIPGVAARSDRQET